MDFAKSPQGSMGRQRLHYGLEARDLVSRLSCQGPRMSAPTTRAFLPPKPPRGSLDSLSEGCILWLSEYNGGPHREPLCPQLSCAFASLFSARAPKRGHRGRVTATGVLLPCKNPLCESDRHRGKTRMLRPRYSKVDSCLQRRRQAGQGGW